MAQPEHDLEQTGALLEEQPSAEPGRRRWSLSLTAKVSLLLAAALLGAALVARSLSPPGAVEATQELEKIQALSSADHVGQLEVQIQDIQAFPSPEASSSTTEIATTTQKPTTTTKSATTTKNATSKEEQPSCQDALPGDRCYRAVLWVKWVDLIERPWYYHGLDRTYANRPMIQEYLYNRSQAGCKLPCNWETTPYPLPNKANGTPSLFCFAVARKGVEMDTMFMQRQVGAGIFACDDYAVVSDWKMNIDGVNTTQIQSTASYGKSLSGWAANVHVFIEAWNAVLADGRWKQHDFIVKADPDAIIFPERLRGHVKAHLNQKVFFENCGKSHKAEMYGALEVYSRPALEAYSWGHPRCEKSIPWWRLGEDNYLTYCMQMLGAYPVVDYQNFLHDERCWGVDCGNKYAVAFHAFKSVNGWYRCWLQSNQHGY